MHAMTSRRSPRKRVPDAPDIPDVLDPAPGRLDSRALWECVRAGGDVEVGDQVADAELRESVWSSADLSGRRLTGFRSRDTRFEGCDLSGALLDGASLLRVEFVGCRMMGVVFSGATLQDVHIRDCRADLANLRMARADYLLVEDSSLREAEFYQASLARSALLGCDLHGANVRDCELTEVDLHGSSLAELRGALSLRGARISADQLLALAPALAAEAGIEISPRS